MPKSSNQKKKLLYLLDMLREHTDEKHVLTTKEIIERLAANGISAERKSIYDDIRALQDYGYDILQTDSRNGGGYWLASRELELAEVKLLVDAVQASRFITTKKSRELIRKLERMTSRHDAVKLQRQVYVAGRIKTENESIYYSIDTIHEAIQENMQIQFSYLEWNRRKELKPRKDQKYLVSPWALVWREENYYLVAFDPKDGIMKHYRVDKMGSVKLTGQKREGRELAEQLDLAAYANRTFGMFGGEQETVTLRFKERLIGVVIDRFGKEADILPDEEGYLKCRIKIAVSNQFFGWIAGIGSEANIAAPAKIREQYREYLKELLNLQQ